MSQWQRKEPAPFDPIPGKLLAKLVELAGGPLKAAAELGVNPAHLRVLLNWSHLRVA